MNKEFRGIMGSIVCVVAATGVTALMRAYTPLGQDFVFGAYLVAVAVAAWGSGVLAGMLTMVVSIPVAGWFFIEPVHSLHVAKSDDWVRIFVFLFTATLINFLLESRSRVRKSLRESESRLRFSLDSSGIGCWDADIAGGKFWKSHNLPAIFGRTEADFATTYEGFFAYIYPEDREFFHLASVGAGTDRRDYEISHRIICADSGIRRVTTRGRMYLNSEGEVVRMVGAVYVTTKLSPQDAGYSEREFQPLPRGTANQA